ncbi:hypothetical protein GCM10007940_20760 [Portibacter lacus]|uniref:OmpR/PhoB-type domain-containing protein n=1 Tax=Portibacter lacus TaxID=1099794 RepID=A0AA37SN09_9BACT|nr:hypothetical protein GCM10007940_20760 [Portibacter lacus]
MDDEYSEIVKIALRDAGNKLLLTNQDSTSRVLPITKIGNNRYQLSFQNTLSIQPDSLVSIMESSLAKLGIPEHYRVEVLQCEDSEVAYSYEMMSVIDNSEIPCAERDLPDACYILQVRFLNGPDLVSITYLILLAIVILSFGFAFRKKEDPELAAVERNYAMIGNYEFHLEQSKLVFNQEESNLTKKECELLEILNERINETVKRDELMKRIWEDNGVFVGRSLDTYISKLRKKLKLDSSIKISNVHGVGYKLEVQV